MWDEYEPKPPRKLIPLRNRAARRPRMYEPLHNAVVEDLRRHMREAVVKARMEAGLTQRELSARIGVSDKVIGGIERGAHLVSLPLFRRICLALALDANAVLGLNPRRFYQNG